jgi:hypothetical protein
MSAAMPSIKGFSEELTSRDLTRSSTHERFLQFAARLLYINATSGWVTFALTSTETLDMTDTTNTTGLSGRPFSETSLPAF